ncbi:MAG: patatin-like phospholipase family protein [Acidobacteriota bacterium]
MIRSRPLPSVYPTLLTLPLLAALSVPSSVSGSTRERPKLAVVLSGGGARGGAHIGVLRRLEEEGVPIDLIVGTSFGALVGGLYGVGYSTRDIELILQRIDWNDLVDDTPDRRLLDLETRSRADERLLELHFRNLDLQLPTGLQAGQKIKLLLDRLTVLPTLEAGNDFDRFPTPFRAVATDILTGKARVFRRGSLGAAIRASISVPGIFSPVEEGNTLLVDGGIASNLPVEIALGSGASLIIAVDVSTPLKSRKEEVHSLFDVLDQVISIHIEENRRKSLERAQVVIQPDLKGFSSLDFSHAATLVGTGYEATEAQLPKIRALLRANSIDLPASGRRASMLDPSRFDPNQEEVSSRKILPDRVEIEGLKRYSRLVRNDPTPASPLSLKSIDDKVSTLYGTGLFEKVGYRLEKEKGKTVLTYQLSELPATKAGFGLRYDRDYNFTAAVDLTSRGLLDSRTDVSIHALIGDFKSADVEFKRQPLAGSRSQLSARVHYRFLERLLFNGNDSTGEFDDERLGFQFSFRHNLGKPTQLEVAYDIERVDVEGRVDRLGPLSPAILAGLRAEVRSDTLDDFDFPNHGSVNRFSFEWQDPALGGDFSFTRFIASADHYFSPTSKSTFGLNGAWGLVSDRVPFYERLFSGGAHYLRASSLPFVGLDRDQLASRHLFYLGASYRYRIKTLQLGLIRNIYWGLRYQSGLFNREDDLLDFQSLLHGFGGGLYLDTRFIGPIRLEAGGTNRKDFNVYFSVGHFF